MRAAQDVTRQLIRDLAEGRGGFEATWVADLMYDGERRIEGLQIAEPDISWDLGRFVEASGTVQVVWSDPFGSSMVPRQIGDWFSPFGGELQIDMIIRAGSFVDRIPMGRFVIMAVPAAEDRRMLFDDRWITPGETFTLEISDRLAKVARDEFLVPVQASSSSAWQEIQSITGFPVIRSTTDRDVPSSMVYEGEKPGILNKIFDLMGAWPHLTADGVLTALSKEWGPPVDEVRGTVSAPVAMTAERTYNAVIVEGEGDDGEPIFATAEIGEGILRTRNTGGGASPFGRHAYRYTSKYLRTFDQCADYARELLARVSRLQGVRRTITEPLNPLREAGDVLRSTDGLVRVVQVKHRGAVTESVVESPDE